MRIWGSVDSMYQLHVADIVDVNLTLEHYHQSFTIHFDPKNRGRKRELAYRRIALR